MAQPRKKINNRPEVLLKLSRKQRGKCFMCQKPVDIKLQRWLDASPEIDHIIALANGGEDHIDNWCLMHRLCNAKKSDLTWNLAVKQHLAEQKYPLVFQ